MLKLCRLDALLVACNGFLPVLARSQLALIMLEVIIDPRELATQVAPIVMPFHAPQHFRRGLPLDVAGKPLPALSLAHIPTLRLS